MLADSKAPRNSEIMGKFSWKRTNGFHNQIQVYLLDYEESVVENV